MVVFVKLDNRNLERLSLCYMLNMWTLWRLKSVQMVFPINNMADMAALTAALKIDF